VVVEFAILFSVFHLYPLVIQIASRCIGKKKLQAYISLINKRRLFCVLNIFLSVVGSIPATGLRTYAWQQ
jgi:hypothetical protein